MRNVSICFEDERWFFVVDKFGITKLFWDEEGGWNISYTSVNALNVDTRTGEFFSFKY